ncbi:hypothetical protein AMTRI_Chr12g238870 [Amborella trichopoda]
MLKPLQPIPKPPFSSLPLKTTHVEDHPNPPQNHHPISLLDEKRQRRKLSNRLSARRSRMRKQQHLDDLRHTVSRLSYGNDELARRVALASDHLSRVIVENERLRLEYGVLRKRLSDYCHNLVLREIEISCNGDYFTGDFHVPFAQVSMI